MKGIVMGILSAIAGIGAAQADMPESKNAHDFTFTTIEGEPLPLSQYEGKVLLIVNTASECGFTGQYTGLQKLYEEYGDDGLVVIGVPSNDFGGQEPGSEEEIKKFCEVKYDITFPLTAKKSVTGESAHPFYRWARSEMGFLGAPKWNFHKYVVGRDGGLIDYFSSTTGPDSANLKKKISEALEKTHATAE